MGKRSSKVIALVLAGMSAAYTIPASAKVIELSEKEGDFSNAIAFNNGKNIYDGYKDDNDSGIYYNNGKTDIKLEDIDDWDNFKKYSNKYVVDDDEGYKINLEDGTYEDDYIGEEDNKDTISSKLKTKLSKTNRYGKDVNVERVENINNNTFSNDIWYSYVAQSSDSYDGSVFDENTDKNELYLEILKIFSSKTQLRIGDKEFVVNGNSEEDIEALIKQIKCANFTKYTVSNIDKIKIENGEKSEAYGITFSIKARSGYTLPNKENFEEIKYYDGSQWIAMNSSDISVKTQDDIIAEQVKSKIKIEINAFYDDITICGKTFSPAWGTKLVESLEKEIKAATFDGYTVISTVAEQSETDNNSGKLTIILGSKEELNEVPGDLILFAGNKPDWEMNASLVKDEADDFISSDDSNQTTGAAVIVEDSEKNGTDSILSKDELNQTTGSGVVVESIANDAKLSGEDKSEGLATYYGYYNEDGTYMDCSEMANLTIYNGTRIVKFDKFNTSKDIDGFKMKIGLPEFVATLGQDDNYIYSLIKVSILGAKKESDNSDINEPIYYVQKISKASNGKVDGANLPSSVESFQLDNRGWDGGDNWSYTAAYTRIIDAYLNDPESVKITCIDGEIYLGALENNKAVNVRVKLKRNAKGLLEDGTEVREKMVSVDTSNETDDEPFDWTVDKNGNVWSIYKGKIQKSSQGSEFQDVYKVDRTMDRLDVYDENNLIAWSTDTGIYTTVQEGEIATNNVTKTGWQSVDGNWYLYDISGKITTGWHVVNNFNWYYFNDEGIMQKGWLQLNGKTYYLSNSGIMKKGWVKIDNKWYYFNQSGEKQINTTIDGYILNENGEWIY
ncbi:N-acetylmuramoyl-L-alanine amidase family protein [Clostridium butyricum]